MQFHPTGIYGAGCLITEGNVSSVQEFLSPEKNLAPVRDTLCRNIKLLFALGFLLKGLLILMSFLFYIYSFLV